MPSTAMRTETDSFGPIKVPADSYWGAQTERSIENFPFGPREQLPLEIVHASFLSDNLTFLLDASLGLISIEQNAAMKLFSWAAVVFLPPTLIAGIFGMNFHYMPELSWRYGYPLSLVLMLATAVGPYLYFKKRGWI
jgi:hypothetical protein